ncbi:outer membrane beta-barrel protein [Geobacter pelophilus]|jgi:hypothetical protein|uniref:Outer membrane beta-barrel protein n=1 Tax=Geoanaerobacter pelophilus TaxID=60036 RepID=A0AAW4L5T9_9BACT|nr:outer membrane beta-barrel protein [Geoanaerobacter pelophilus]MBT0666268.1 outer membrane beta-barrel protein [Geoanaerobacter pelophilus]
MKCLIPVIVAVFVLFTSSVGREAAAADFDWMKKNDQVDTAEKSYGKQYVLFRGGPFFQETPSGMNVGEGAEAGYGIQPLRWLAAEASLGFLQADDYDDNLSNLHRSFQMVPVTGTVRAIFPFKQFDIYALAGGGMYYTMMKVDNRNQDISYADDDKVLLGFHYGGGVSLLLGGVSSVGLEVKRIETKWDALDISGTFLTAYFRMGL